MEYKVHIEQSKHVPELYWWRVKRGDTVIAAGDKSDFPASWGSGLMAAHRAARRAIKRHEKMLSKAAAHDPGYDVKVEAGRQDFLEVANL